MSKFSVFCIARNDTQAVEIVQMLKAGNFSAGDISVVFSDKTESQDFAREEGTKAPEGAAAGGVAGGVLGGVAGWLVGIGAVTIPGIGPLIAAGPMMAVVSGAAVGGAVGGIAGALIGLGIPEPEAARYESRVKSGSILISVHTDDHNHIRRAEQIFKSAGGENISIGGESAPADDGSQRNTVPETQSMRLISHDDIVSA